MSKHVKTRRPTDADLKGNPMIGAGKGTTAAGDAVDLLAGENTIEGDVGNDVNAHGGLDKNEPPGRGVQRPKVMRPGRPS